MCNGAGFINVMWMFVGIWMGLFLARALPDSEVGDRQVPAVQPEPGPAER